MCQFVAMLAAISHMPSRRCVFVLTAISQLCQCQHWLFPCLAIILARGSSGSRHHPCSWQIGFVLKAQSLLVCMRCIISLLKLCATFCNWKSGPSHLGSFCTSCSWAGRSFLSWLPSTTSGVCCVLAQTWHLQEQDHRLTTDLLSLLTAIDQDSHFCNWKWCIVSWHPLDLGPCWPCRSNLRSLTGHLQHSLPTEEALLKEHPDLPDHVIIALLKHEHLLTQVKLNALYFEHITGDQCIKDIKAQACQVSSASVAFYSCGPAML